MRKSVMADFLMRAEYVKVKELCQQDFKSRAVASAILEFALVSLKYLLTQCQPIELVSKVSGKQYFTFGKANTVARPVNKSLFLTDPNEVNTFWNRWVEDGLSSQDLAKLSYTIALSPCLAMEIFDRQNKKGPATFFECYIGHLFAKALDSNPTKRVRLPINKRNILMTMDFLFDVPSTSQKIHLPVKMSTRERVVQAWAHQRLLDVAYGDEVFRGIMVLFSETKMDSRSLEVVEICVPDHWLAYQSLLAKRYRFYSFDPPERYLNLSEENPEIIMVKQFSQFFTEKEVVLQKKHQG